MKKHLSKLLAILMFVQMAPFSYAQMMPATVPIPTLPPPPPAPELPVYDVGSRCLTDEKTKPGILEFYFCEDDVCTVTNKITCAVDALCIKGPTGGYCDYEIPDDIEPTSSIGEKPVVSTPEIEPEPVTVDTPEPEKTEIPEGIDLPDLETLGIDPEAVITGAKDIITNDKSDIKTEEKEECETCKRQKEISETIDGAVKTIVGFDPKKTPNGMEAASLAMTNNVASNIGTTVSLGLAYPFAIAGGVIADVVTGIPITVIKVFGGEAEYVGATKKIHNGFADGFKKAWKAIWG